MENYPRKRRKNNNLMRSLLDYGMGIVILGTGAFAFFGPRLGYYLQIDDLMRYFFVAICILYGGFRIYRGYARRFENYDEE